MGRVKPSKFEIFLNYKLWLSSVTGEGIIEEDRYKLLQLIKERGSLRAAASEMKISYRKAGIPGSEIILTDAVEKDIVEKLRL